MQHPPPYSNQGMGYCMGAAAPCLPKLPDQLSCSFMWAPTSSSRSTSDLEDSPQGQQKISAAAATPSWYALLGYHFELAVCHSLAWLHLPQFSNVAACAWQDRKDMVPAYFTDKVHEVAVQCCAPKGSAREHGSNDNIASSAAQTAY